MTDILIKGMTFSKICILHRIMHQISVYVFVICLLYKSVLLSESAQNAPSSQVELGDVLRGFSFGYVSANQRKIVGASF